MTLGPLRTNRTTVALRASPPESHQRPALSQGGASYGGGRVAKQKPRQGAGLSSSVQWGLPARG